MGELFATYEKDGTPSGVFPREQVHREGLWHRAVNVFVFNLQGQVLLQKRSDSKDVCPSSWDLSCAEHLIIEESYDEGARRGLREELGLTVCAPTPLGGVFSSEHQTPQGWDRELQQCFAGVTAEVPRPNPDEVAQVRWQAFTPFAQQARGTPPGNWTPWLIEGLRRHLRELTAFHDALRRGKLGPQG